MRVETLVLALVLVLIALAIAIAVLVVVRTRMRERLDAPNGQKSINPQHRPHRILVRRSVFEYQLLRAIKRQPSWSKPKATVFCIGLDGLKYINSEFGYDVGDQVLSTVAQRLRALSDLFDSIAFVGGDEFCAFSTNASDSDSFAKLAQHLIKAIAAPQDLAGTNISVSCSVGISSFPRHTPPDRLLIYAQAAMRSAKAKGAGSHALYAGDCEELAHRAPDMARSLRDAVTRGELHLVFQPKLDAKTGKITSAEALLRWKRGSQEIPPSTFIPVAERFGVIEDIGEWVINDTCRQIREWREKGLRMRVAVNVSARQLLQVNFAQRVREILKSHNVHPWLLTVEITESLPVECLETSRLTLLELERIGLHVSIDDFGTGHTSLTYLRRLPANELKIDRSYVTDLEECEHSHSIVDAIIRMAHALGKRVVAEGVETQAQVRTLR